MSRRVALVRTQRAGKSYSRMKAEAAFTVSQTSTGTPIAS